MHTLRAHRFVGSLSPASLQHLVKSSAPTVILKTKSQLASSYLEDAQTVLLFKAVIKELVIPSALFTLVSLLFGLFFSAETILHVHVTTTTCNRRVPSTPPLPNGYILSDHLSSISMSLASGAGQIHFAPELSKTGQRRDT